MDEQEIYENVKKSNHMLTFNATNMLQTTAIKVFIMTSLKYFNRTIPDANNIDIAFLNEVEKMLHPKKILLKQKEGMSFCHRFCHYGKERCEGKRHQTSYI